MRAKAINPIDGRYRNRTRGLSQYFSEKAYSQFRIQVEIEYLLKLIPIVLPNVPEISHEMKNKLQAIHFNFSTHDFEKLCLIEQKIRHDVKSVEYFIKQKLEQLATNSQMKHPSTPPYLLSYISDSHLRIFQASLVGYK